MKHRVPLGPLRTQGAGPNSWGLLILLIHINMNPQLGSTVLQSDKRETLMQDARWQMRMVVKGMTHPCPSFRSNIDANLTLQCLCEIRPECVSSRCERIKISTMLRMLRSED
jgi:hypothetical protein